MTVSRSKMSQNDSYLVFAHETDSILFICLFVYDLYVLSKRLRQYLIENPNRHEQSLVVADIFEIAAVNINKK